jgi:LmbE family N-acetylglucosaminyl deacetylase
MKFHINEGEIIIPDKSEPEDALTRTTHMCIGAHPDDIEIMAAEGIMKCYHSQDQWFTGVTLTNGGGSPRSGAYQYVTDEQMRSIRHKEQEKAAMVGEYSAQILLGYRDLDIKNTNPEKVAQDLVTILEKARPDVVYTHNLADKHDTHVSACLRVIEAIRKISIDSRPKVLFGCEVWRGLDWLSNRDKNVLDCSQKQNIQAALLGIHDSQISGGKRYDLAVQGRNRANATFHETIEVDFADSISFAMDMTPLVIDADLDPIN